MVETFDITELHESKTAADNIRRDLAEMEINFENRLGQLGRLETIGSLAGGIAHDFNNILATISGYTEMLQEDFPGEELLMEKTNKILSAVSRARSLTSQVLTFSRQVEQDKVLTDLNEVLKETVGFIRSSAAQNIAIRARYCKQIPMIQADPTQLFRVFHNLMNNAFQSMEKKGGTLSVSTLIVEGSKVKPNLSKDIIADSYILTRFRDTGRGIDPAFIGRIFEPFFTLREVGKGTGLGLSVVHGIVSDLEGEVSVNSKPGVGSVFDVYLPVPINDLQHKNKIAEKNKVLIIRGNLHESNILSIALENSGFKVEFVADLNQLSGKFSTIKFKPAVIIYMADSEKITIEDLRRFYYNLQLKVPCILITDKEKEEIREELINLGVVRQHLLKPVSLKDLRNAIQISLHPQQINKA
jgi:signal transduction histidine kinase